MNAGVSPFSLFTKTANCAGLTFDTSTAQYTGSSPVTPPVISSLTSDEAMFSAQLFVQVSFRTSRGAEA